MSIRWSLLALALVVAPAMAQEPYSVEETPVWPTQARPTTQAESSGSFQSTRKFSNFIGFMSNPLQNIDPRSLTQIQPLFISSWLSPAGRLPDSDAQVFGPAVSIAVTDRFSVGMNQGGYAFAHIDRFEPLQGRNGPIIDRIRQRRQRSPFGGTREGFLNLGGFAQYTLIEDVEDQFLLTAGIRLEVPTGSYEIFQGRGPAQMAPYLTIGKELGDYHFLATGGYEFGLAQSTVNSDQFYLNCHLDRQLFGCFYPLVEVNWIYHSRSVNVNLPTQRGFFDFGNFGSQGNLVSMAAGANWVVIRDRLEFGGVYNFPLATQRNFDFDGLLLKMTLRY